MDNQVNAKLWNASYILIIIMNTLTSIGFTMITPILVKYAVGMNASMAVAGILAGLFSITALIFRPFAGFSSDRFNKKRLLLVSAVLLAVSALGYGISSHIYLLFIFRIIHGAAFAFSSTASNSLGASFIPRQRLGEGMGYLGLSHIIAMAIGPNISIMIVERFGYSYVFYFSFFVICLSILLMSRLKYSNQSVVKARSGKFRLKFSDLIASEILIFAVIGGMFSLMNGLISSFIVILGDNRGIGNIGIYFIVNGAVLFFIRPLSGKLLDRKGLSFIIIPAFILAALAGILVGLATSLWMILLAAILYATGQGAGHPALQASCIKKLGPDRTGVAVSTYFIGADVGQGIGPVIGGAIAGAFGIPSVYFMGSGILIGGMLLYMIYSKVNRINKAEHIQ